MKVITDFRVLLKLAKDMADARKKGDESEIERATKIHNDYRDLCLLADEMVTGLTFGDL